MGVKTGKDVPCKICGKMIYRQLSTINQYQKHYCSQKCLHKSLIKHERNKCLNCGTLVSRKSPLAKYCSVECWSEHRKQLKSIKCIKCKYCGKMFDISPAHIKSSKHHYCSHKCSDSARKKRTQMKCECCGKIYLVRPSIKKRRLRRFCSHQCYYQYNRGANSNKWKGGAKYSMGRNKLAPTGMGHLIPNKLIELKLLQLELKQIAKNIHKENKNGKTIVNR